MVNASAFKFSLVTLMLKVMVFVEFFEGQRIPEDEGKVNAHIPKREHEYWKALVVDWRNLVYMYFPSVSIGAMSVKSLKSGSAELNCSSINGKMMKGMFNLGRAGGIQVT